MKPYSIDLRKRIIEAYENGEGTMRKLAKRFKVSLSFIQKLFKRYGATGRVEPKPPCSGPLPKLQGANILALRRLVEEDNSATLAELAERLKEQNGIEVSEPTISKTLRYLGYTRKKHSWHAAERDQDPELDQERESFQQQQAQLDASKLKFIDEMGVNVGLSREYGWAEQGQRALGSKPVNVGSNISVIGCLGLEGMSAIMVLEGSINGAALLAFVEHILVPTLKPADIVYMDNVNTHKNRQVAEAIRTAGAEVRFLPRYSPEFSPIESYWSKMKAWLRGSAARTGNALQGEIRNALDEVTKSDIEGWFEHCGYCIPST